MAPASIRNCEAGVWRARRHRASAVRDTAFERHLMHFAKVPPDYEAAGVRGALQMNREKASENAQQQIMPQGHGGGRIHSLGL